MKRKRRPPYDARSAIHQELVDWADMPKRPVPFRTSECIVYVAINDLLDMYQSCGRCLEDYLTALLIIAKMHDNRPSIGFQEFFQMLKEAFTSAVPPFADGWRLKYDEHPEKQTGFEGWEAKVLRQIVDIHEMTEQRTECGTDGIRSPRGTWWVNPELANYLSTAAYHCSDMKAWGARAEVSWEDFRTFLTWGQAGE
jgi:hypothetical protein